MIYIIKPCVIVESDRDASIVAQAGFFPVVARSAGIGLECCFQAAERVIASGTIPRGTVVLAFDSDGHGRDMCAAFADLLGHRARSIALPHGLRGVDELAQAHGLDGVRAAVQSARPV